MNPLQRALIEKAGNDSGFEYVLPSEKVEQVILASARHRVKVEIRTVDDDFLVEFHSPTMNILQQELSRSFPHVTIGSGGYRLSGVDGLAILLRRAAALSQSLPNQAAIDFEAQCQAELAGYPKDLLQDTEVERLVRQRVGQQAFRKAMLAYWGGACAVTGVAIPEVLRASHAKPWADCDSDAERLDVFNGFLLTANLDALFDRFLITFTGEGVVKISESLLAEDRTSLGLNEGMRLRWLSNEHLQYLEYHRERFITM